MKMFQFNSTLPTLSIFAALIFFSTAVFSQPPESSVSAETKFVSSVKTPDTQNGKISDAEFGTVIGRVLYERDRATDGPLTDLDGIAGVKVLARRVNAGLGNFYFERQSAEDGTFEFKYLAPGDYEIEIDRATLPNAYPAPPRRISTVAVQAARRTHFDLHIAPPRAISGVVFIDADGDGAYKPGKDHVIAGATVSANGCFAVSDENGVYVLKDLPAGRVALLVSSAANNANTHVVLDIANGPVTNRIVNVPIIP